MLFRSEVSKLPGMVQKTDKYINRMFEKQYSKPVLEKELKKIDDTIKGNEEKIKSLAAEKSDIMGRADLIMIKLDDTLEVNEEFSVAAKAHLKETFSEWKALQKEITGKEEGDKKEKKVATADDVKKKMKDISDNILDVASELKTIENPITGKKEDFATFKQSYARFQSALQEKF